MWKTECCTLFLAKVITTKYPNIPIPEATAEQQKPIIALVDKILSAKKDNPQNDTSTLESQIDDLVYDLYGLTDDDVKIIESANRM